MNKKNENKITNMKLMLFPWCPLWFIMTSHPTTASILGIALSIVLPFTFIKWKATIFDILSGLIVTGISIFVLLGYPLANLVPLSYLLFGLMWSTTVFLKVPLTAYYTCNKFGQEKAFKLPIFMKTNRILTGCWGFLYLLTPIWTFYFMHSPNNSHVGTLNTVVPICLGVFTKYFQKYYPAYCLKKLGQIPD